MTRKIVIHELTLRHRACNQLHLSIMQRASHDSIPVQDTTCRIVASAESSMHQLVHKSHEKLSSIGCYDAMTYLHTLYEVLRSGQETICSCRVWTLANCCSYPDLLVCMSLPLYKVVPVKPYELCKQIDCFGASNIGMLTSHSVCQSVFFSIVEKYVQSRILLQDWSLTA